jgi:hypothetical protein
MLIIIIFIIILLKKYLINYNILIKKCKESYDMKTGDIILFRSSKANFLYSIFTSFTHVGIVIKSDKLYILETHKLGDTLDMNLYVSGVNLYDLKFRLSTYNGNAYLLRLKKEISDNNQILDKINKYKSEFEFPNNHKIYYISKCFFNINNRNDNKLLCSEFIYYVLLDNNIISNDNKYLCMKPSDYIYLDEYEYCGLI